MQEITSIHNPKVKAAIKLHSSRGRSQQGRFVVFGMREIERAIATQVEVLECFVCPDRMKDDDLTRIQELVSSARLFSVPLATMEKLEFGERQEGVVLVVNRPNTELRQNELPRRCLTLVLESIEKPGNLGAILRSCDGAGVDMVILADPLTDFFHPNCIRASMGAVFSTRLARASTEDVQSFLKDQRFQVLPAVVDAQRSYRTADYLADRTAIVFGNEARGLGDAWKQSDYQPIYIPMNGIADSLNVSVSAAIVMYEAVARRQERPIDATTE